MRIRVTVPEGFTEISNGRLQRTVPLGEHRTRFEWAVSYPINNYNVTFSIGKYAHYTDLYDSLTLDFYVLPYHISQSTVFFSTVKRMLACYEKLFGPYPFLRDGFTLVESPHAMEHQSRVCVGPVPSAPRAETAAVVWHESAHEWWGNNISCRDLADMWIHEAFATYAEGYLYGGQDTLKEYMRDLRDQVFKRPLSRVYTMLTTYTTRYGICMRRVACFIPFKT